jgi:hypothetical protein
MALNAKNKKRPPNPNFVEQAVIEEGTYPCRVAQIIELGLQPQRPHQGKEKPPVDMLYITYELTDEFMLDKDGDEILDKPRWQSEDFPYYGLDCTTAKCNKRLKAIDPKNEVDGDWAEIGGMACNVTFIHNVKGDKTYINVASVAAVRAKDAKGIEELKNPVKTFDLDEPDMDVYEALPQWLRTKIASNLNFKGSVLEEAIANVGNKEEEEKPEPEEEEKPKAKKKKSRKAPVKEEADEEEDGEDIPW